MNNINTTNIDKFNKPHTGKDIKTGTCQFPFNYKGFTSHTKCIDGKTGKWCPTTLTQRRYPKTWAYCQDTKSLSIANPKKTLKTKPSISKSPKKVKVSDKSNTSSKISNSYPLSKRLDILRHIIPKIDNIKCNNIDSILYYLDADNKIKSGIKMIGRGSSGIVYSSCIDIDCSQNLVIKFIKIKTDFKYSRNNHPVKVEIKFLRDFSEKLLQTGICPHLLFYYADFDCKMDTFLALNSVSSSIKEAINHEYINGGILNKMKVLFIEETDTDLHRLITSRKLTDIEFLVILFQLFYSMITIQYYFPGFRHNDLKADNILVRTYPIIADHYYTYKIFGRDYHIPDIGIKLKIWDFDFSVSNTIANNKIDIKWSDEFGATNDINPIYDIHSFMNISLVNLRKFIPKNMVKMFESNLTTEDVDLLNLSVKYKPKNIKLIGESTEYTKFGRLTGYKKKYTGLPINIIPDDMYSFGDYLLDEDTPFNYFLEKNKQFNYQLGSLLNVYDSKIPDNLDTKKRNDIFNIFEE